MEIQEEKLIEWFKLKGLSDKSIENYLYYFNKLELNNLNNKHFIEFLTRYNNLIARAMLKNLFLFIKTGEFEKELKDLVRDFDIPRQTGRKKQRIPKVISVGEVNMIANKMKDRRNEIMVLLSFYCGLRPFELLQIETRHINWEDWLKNQELNGTLRVIGKGNKERTLPLMKDIIRYTYWWIQETMPKIKPEERLFKICARHWRKVLGNASYKAIGRRIYPHLLRHSCASYLAEQGLDSIKIARFLGHVSVDSTQIYIHMNVKKLHAEIGEIFRPENNEK